MTEREAQLERELADAHCVIRLLVDERSAQQKIRELLPVSEAQFSLLAFTGREQ